MKPAVQATLEWRVFETMAAWARAVLMAKDLAPVVQWVASACEDPVAPYDDMWQAVLWLDDSVDEMCLSRGIWPDTPSQMLLLLGLDDLRRLPVVYEMSARLHRFTSAATQLSFMRGLARLSGDVDSTSQCCEGPCKEVGLLPVGMGDPALWEEVHAVIHDGYVFGTATGMQHQPYLPGLMPLGPWQ